MYYIIDGYNLLFRILTSSVDLATRRKVIIENLNKKISLIGIEVMVVFDSRLQEGSKSHFDHLEIQFTSLGVTADEWIIEKVKHIPNKTHVTVVTSDKKLGWQVRRSSVKTETIEEFVTTLNKRYKNKLEAQKSKPEGETFFPTISLSHPLKEKRNDETKRDETKRVPSSPVILKPKDCFEYYLNEFEKNFNEIAPPEKRAEPEEKPKKHKFPKKPKIEAPELSDMERWQKLFENPPD